MSVDVAAERERVLGLRADRTRDATLGMRARMVLAGNWNATRHQLFELIREKYPKDELAEHEAILDVALRIQKEDRPRIDPATVSVRPPELEGPVRKPRRLVATVSEPAPAAEPEPESEISAPPPPTPAPKVPPVPPVPPAEEPTRVALRNGDRELLAQVEEYFREALVSDTGAAAAAIAEQLLRDRGIQLSREQAFHIRARAWRALQAARREPRTRMEPVARSKDGPKVHVPAETREKVRELVRERLKENPDVTRPILLEEVNAKFGLSISLANFDMTYWGKVREELGLKGRVPSTKRRPERRSMVVAAAVEAPAAQPAAEAAAPKSAPPDTPTSRSPAPAARPPVTSDVRKVCDGYGKWRVKLDLDGLTTADVRLLDGALQAILDLRDVA